MTTKNLYESLKNCKTYEDIHDFIECVFRNPQNSFDDIEETYMMAVSVLLDHNAA